MVTTSNCIVAYFDIFAFSPTLEEDPPRVIGELESLWNWIRQRAASNDAHAYLFSDCGFLLFPVSNLESEGEYRLLTCISELSQLYDQYVKRGFLLRGGVTYGAVTYSENLIIGKVVVDAVRLESDQCLGPFILVPSRTINALINPQSLIRPISERLIRTKDDGEISGHVIFPVNREQYIMHIQKRHQIHLAKSDTSYARFWHDTLRFVYQEFHAEFHSYFNSGPDGN